MKMLTRNLECVEGRWHLFYTTKSKVFHTFRIWSFTNYVKEELTNQTSETALILFTEKVQNLPHYSKLDRNCYCIMVATPF